MEQLRRGLRALRYGWAGARSWLLLTSYRMQYSGFRAGQGVRLERGVYVSVASGGRIAIADNVFVGANAVLTADGGTIEIGANGHVGAGTVIVADERIVIGPDALIADYVTIRDQNHGIGRTDLPYRQQRLSTRPIEVGRNVWIGAGAAVLAGASIGENCVVGANAVVTGALPADSVCVGAPARAIRKVGEAARGG